MDTVIALGRVIGDGAFYFYVQDVVVLPEHQGNGIGTVIVESLIEQVEHNLRKIKS